MAPRSVGIVGGGISGLSVAYHLIREGFSGSVTVYEATPTLGGNADTAEVLLGTDFRDAEPESFTRLADLGVNDVNLTAYRRLACAMREIGYYDACAGQDDALRPLEDSIAFFTPDGREIWTDDKYLVDRPDPATFRPRQGGVFDLRFSLQNRAHAALREAEDSFMRKAAEEFDPDHCPMPSSWRLSTREYVEHFRRRHLCGPDPLFPPELLDDVVRLFLMPRIAAMYFASETGPEKMPFRGVMNYYRLQEGFGIKGKPDRRYFTRGSQDWIDALGRWLEQAGVTIRRGYRAKVRGVTHEGARAVEVTDATGNGLPETVDAVVMAAHADHQLAAIQRGDDPLLTEEMARDLGSVQHSISRAVAHTWTGALPANVGCWRTYNVMIREGEGLMPYQMTYVQNRHRNDALNPDYDQFGLPIYFVTLNPQVPIPDAHVLRVTKGSVEERLQLRPGYGWTHGADGPDPARAVAWFRHVVMTDTLLDIQDRLPKRQGTACGRVYFAGCWTNGAGLHEQCFEQAERIVAAMLD